MASGEATSAAAFLPPTRDLAALGRAAAGCRGCELWRRGTQTVFGEGAERATLLLVGEQPGDLEDRAGRPFVGPAGRLLDRALGDAGIDRARVWVTNAVKHFKWASRGGRRIHQKPTAREIAACRPWLEAELAAVRPRLVVALGATAAQSLLGGAFRLTRHRGEVVPSPFGPVVATVHPAAILRAPDRATRHREAALFVRDLRAAAAAAGRGRRGGPRAGVRARPSPSP
jgi:DNA polymerase